MKLEVAFVLLMNLWIYRFSEQPLHAPFYSLRLGDAFLFFTVLLDLMLIIALFKRSEE